MNCEQAKNKFIEYLYGELKLEEKASVQTHIEECVDCAARLAELRQARQWVAGLSDPEPSQIAVNRILARAREEAERSRAGWRLGWLRVFVPLCFMVVVGGLVAYHYWSGWVAQQGVLISGGPKSTRPVSPEETLRLEQKMVRDEDMPAERRREEGKVTEEKDMAGPIGAAEREKFRVPSGETPSPRPRARALESEARLARPTRDLDSGLLVRAEEALEAGDYARARETFQEIVAHLDPSDPVRSRALLGLARTYEELDELDEARKVYETLAHESPSLRELANRKIQELLERQ